MPTIIERGWNPCRYTTPHLNYMRCCILQTVDCVALPRPSNLPSKRSVRMLHLGQRQTAPCRAEIITILPTTRIIITIIKANLIPDLYQAPFLYFHALDSPPLHPSDLSPAWTDSRGRENKHAARQPSRLGSLPWCPNLLILWHLWERQEEAPPKKRGVALQWRRGSFAHREGAPPRDPLCAPSCAWLTFKMCIHIRVCVQPCDPELEYQSTMF